MHFCQLHESRPVCSGDALGAHPPPKEVKCKIKNNSSMSFVSFCGERSTFYKSTPPFQFLPTGLGKSGFMAHFARYQVTYRLTAKNRDQLRNLRKLGNRATFLHVLMRFNVFRRLRGPQSCVSVSTYSAIVPICRLTVMNRDSHSNYPSINQ